MSQTVDPGPMAGRAADDPSFGRLAALVAELVQEQGFPVRLRPGASTEPVRLDQDRLSGLLIEALLAGGPDRAERVVWVSAGSELLVDLPATRLEILAGALVVGLRIACVQTAEADLSVVLAVGARDGGLPLVRMSGVDGPALLRVRWADAAAGAACSALLRLVALVAAATGTTDRPERVNRPASLWAERGSLLLAARLPYDWEVAG
jgi:hypothetical protein